MISIYNELIARIECLDRDYLSNYQSTSFRRLLHQKLSCNLAINYIKVSNYQLASSIIEDSINYGIKYNYLKLLPEFCMLKVKVLCHENKYDEAKKRLESAKALFDLTNRYSDYKEAEEILQSEFPDFFSNNDKL